MSVIDNSLLLTAPAGSSSYQVPRSLRFNAGDSAYLSKSIPNITTFTLSYWMKRCGSGRDDTFVTESSTGFFYYVHTDGSIRINDNTANRFVSNGLYRDPSAWYHVVINNNGTTFNLYVNGVLDKSASVSLALYSGTALIGRDRVSGAASHANFYLADIHFIDDQALDPSSFTTTDLTTGQLVPKAYTGSYGTNGFKLSFSDNSTTAALGTDSSGAGNTWTVNNFSVTAGSGNDSLVDTPNDYGINTGIGGEVRGNYCVLNPLDKSVGNSFLLTNGNLDAILGNSSVNGTVAIPQSGKWYFEATLIQLYYYSTYGGYVGIVKKNTSSWSGTWYTSNTGAGGGIYKNASQVQSIGSAVLNDVVGVAVNMDTLSLQLYRNGSAYGSPVTLDAGTYLPYNGGNGNNSSDSSGWSFNFGQRAWAYTAPAGFAPLIKPLLPAPSVVDYLVVAGGGGGGCAYGGGGGGGGMRSTVTNTGGGGTLESALAVSGGVTYTVTVGAGGGGGGSTPPTPGANGSNSVFSSITSTGGGGGAASENTSYGLTGLTGGSAGGSAGPDGRVGYSGVITGGSRTASPVQGNNGGNSYAQAGLGSSGGGGGGAGAVGGNAGNPVGGNGGNGAATSISGSSVTYAGGGGGGSYPYGSTSGTGGSGGGANGVGTSGTTAPSATANTGGGGGGSNAIGGAGGSGIVIIRYADSFRAASATTGSPTVTETGGYRIYTFTGSGSITF